MSGGEEREVVSGGRPEDGRRLPLWLTRGLAALAAVVLAAVGGLELLGTGSSDSGIVSSPSSPARVQAAEPYDSEFPATVPVLAGALNGRLVVSASDGRLHRGPLLPGGPPYSLNDPPTLLAGMFDGRWILAHDHRLQILSADLSGHSETVQVAGHVLPCSALPDMACIVTADGAVTRMFLPAGRVAGEESVQREVYGKAGWQPRALLGEDTLLLSRHGTGSAAEKEQTDIAIVASWRAHVQVLARDARLLGSYGHIVVTASRAPGSARPALTTHMVQSNGPVVSLQATPPKGWTFVHAPAGFLDSYHPVAYVERGGRRALAVLDPRGRRARLVPGSAGARPARGATKVESSSALVFGVVADGRARYAIWHGDPADPARLLPQRPPPGFRLLDAALPAQANVSPPQSSVWPAG